MNGERARESSADSGTHSSNGFPSVTVLYVIVAVLCFAWWSQYQELTYLRKIVLQQRSPAYQQATFGSASTRDLNRTVDQNTADDYQKKVDEYQEKVDELKAEQSARDAALAHAIGRLNSNDLEEVQLLQAEYEAGLALVEILESRGSCKLEPATPEWMREFLGEDTFQRVTEVSLQSDELEADFDLMVRCSSIRSVSFSGSHLTLKAISQLKALPHLRSLIIGQPGVTDEQLMAISDIESLEKLSIHGSNLTDSGLSKLGQLSRLTELRLEGSYGIADAGLVHLSGLANLHQLELHRVMVTGSGLVNITSLPLEKLWLSYTPLEDNGLLEIAKISTLRDVRIDETRINGAGLQALEQLKDLRSLKIGRGVSVSAYAELRAALPQTHIER